MPQNEHSLQQRRRRHDNLCNFCGHEMELVGDDEDDDELFSDDSETFSDDDENFDEEEESSGEDDELKANTSTTESTTQTTNNISNSDIVTSDEGAAISATTQSNAESATIDESPKSMTSNEEDGDQSAGNSICNTLSTSVEQGADAGLERSGISGNDNQEDRNQSCLSPIKERSFNKTEADKSEKNEFSDSSMRIFEYSSNPERGIDVFVEKIVFDDIVSRVGGGNVSDISSDSLDEAEVSDCVIETNIVPGVQSVVGDKTLQTGVIENSSEIASSSSNQCSLNSENFQVKSFSNNGCFSGSKKTMGTTDLDRNSTNNSNHCNQESTGCSESSNSNQSSLGNISDQKFRMRKFSDSIGSIFSSFFKSNIFPSEQKSGTQPARPECSTWTAEAAHMELTRIFTDLISTIQNASRFSPTNLKASGARKNLAEDHATTSQASTERWRSSSSGSTSSSSSNSPPDSKDFSDAPGNKRLAKKVTFSDLKSKLMSSKSEPGEVEGGCNSPHMSKASKALVRVTTGKRGRNSNGDNSDSEYISSSDSCLDSDLSTEIGMLELLAREHRLMMLQLSKLILLEFEGEDPVNLEKVRDYELCFACMQSEYAQFSNKLNSFLADHDKSTRLSRLCRLRDDNAQYIARVKYGILLFNSYQGFQSFPGNVRILSSLDQFVNDVQGVQEWVKK